MLDRQRANPQGASQRNGTAQLVYYRRVADYGDQMIELLLARRPADLEMQKMLGFSRILPHCKN